MHFWPQIQAFLFLYKILQLDQFDQLDQFVRPNLTSNITILFSKSSPKIPKPGIFGLKFRHFCFSAKFRNQRNSKVLILNMTQPFKVLAQKYPNKAFLVKNTHTRHIGFKFRHFLFSAKFMELDKFEGADIKSKTLLFSNFSQKYTQIRHFWFQIQAFLCFHKIL